jgi:hypothetical protein
VLPQRTVKSAAYGFPDFRSNGQEVEMASIGTVSVKIEADISGFSESLTRELLVEAIAAQLLKHLPRSVGIADIRVAAVALQEQFFIAPKPAESNEHDVAAGNT